MQSAQRASNVGRWMAVGVIALVAACGANVVAQDDSDDGAPECTEHDDCAESELCLFGSGTCAPSCPTPDLPDVCPQGMFCDTCGTSSCPQCRDCMTVCVPD